MPQQEWDLDPSLPWRTQERRSALRGRKLTIGKIWLWPTSRGQFSKVHPALSSHNEGSSHLLCAQNVANTVKGLTYLVSVKSQNSPTKSPLHNKENRFTNEETEPQWRQVTCPLGSPSQSSSRARIWPPNPMALSTPWCCLHAYFLAGFSAWLKGNSGLALKNKKMPLQFKDGEARIECLEMGHIILVLMDCPLYYMNFYL